jgi:hypothetical protein
MGCKRLDDWVVNRLATLFKDSKKDPELRARLGGQRVVMPPIAARLELCSLGRLIQALDPLIV